MYSVIIPTMQRSSRLPALLDTLAGHPLVSEILVINNSEAPFADGREKVRVIYSGPNLGVNPAWNLGVREAIGTNLAILNDDAEFDPLVLPLAAERLDQGAGIIAISSASFRGGLTHSRPRFRAVYFMPYQFGVCMLMRRASYVPIPDDLVLWYGDDWLFRHQVQTNYVVDGLVASTDMSTTASAPQFSAAKQADTRAFQSKYAGSDPYGDAHRLGRWIGRQRSELGRRLGSIRGRVRSRGTSHG